MWLEAFLGPLPANYRCVARQNQGKNYVTFEILGETGEFLDGDPRVKSWPIAADTGKPVKSMNSTQSI